MCDLFTKIKQQILGYSNKTKIITLQLQKQLTLCAAFSLNLTRPRKGKVLGGKKVKSLPKSRTYTTPLVVDWLTGGPGKREYLVRNRIGRKAFEENELKTEKNKPPQRARRGRENSMENEIGKTSEQKKT